MKSFWENDFFIKMSNGFYGKIVLNVNPWVFSFITLKKIFSSNFMGIFLCEKGVFVKVKNLTIWKKKMFLCKISFEDT